MPIVSQGASPTLSAQFYDPASNVPTDPTTLQFQILFEDPNNPATPTLIIGPVLIAGLVRTGEGAYQYVWNIPTNLALGDYQVQWVAIVNGTPQFNFDTVTIVAPTADTQSAQTVIELSTDPHIICSTDHLTLKFDVTPRVVSVFNASYTLFRVQGATNVALDYNSLTDYDDDSYDSAYTISGDPGASNTFVGTPFLPMQKADYNSIARTIKLWFATQLAPNAQYVLVVSGIVDAAGVGAPDQQYLFSVPANIVPSVIPIETPILVEDHSILETPFTSLDVISQLNPTFYLVDTDPGMDLVFVDPTYNNGVITIKFSAPPDPSYLNSTYFTVQCKPLTRGFNRWQTVIGVQITADPVLPWIYLSMPSFDATPTYGYGCWPGWGQGVWSGCGGIGWGNQIPWGEYPVIQYPQPEPIDVNPWEWTPPSLPPIVEYYQNNYKYRVKISGSIALTAQPPFDNLQEDQFLGFLIDPSPFLIDPDVVLPYFPEASYFEVAELIYDSSQEIQDFFDDGQFTQPITPTIRSTLEDYVMADVACNLTRIYEIGNGSITTSVTLGDLTVQQANPSQSQVNRSNATTWCQLAGVIRDEVYNLASKSGMKAVVKGSRYWNPIPRRRIQTQEWRSWGWDRDSEWRQDWN